MPVVFRVFSVADMAELRVFIAETDGAWTELTEGERPVVRLSAPNLQEAARRRRRLPADVAVVLDLAGLVADLVVAGVADGVTLIPVGPDDLQPRAYAALSRIQDRLRIRAA